MTDWRAITVTTPPTAELVTLDDLNDHLRRDTIDADPEADVLQRSLDAAINQFDGPDGLGYAILAQSWTMTLDRFPPRREVIFLPGAPVKSLTSVSYLAPDGQSQAFDAGDPRLDAGSSPARLQPLNAWPQTADVIGAVQVEYVLGEADATTVRAEIIDAVLQMAATLFELRGISTMEGGTVAWPPQARYIMNKYRQGFAG